MRKRKLAVLQTLVMIALFLLSACGPTSEPVIVKETQVVVETKVIKETVVVETEGEKVVEEVTRVVEKVVTATPEPPPTGGEVVLATSGDVNQEDPLQYQAIAFDNAWRNDFVYERLVELDPNTLEPVPLLAESWDISDDGLTYTFNLRKDVTWHDGEPFTAEDVEYALLRLLDPEFTASRSSFMFIEGATEMTEGGSDTLAGVNVVDDYTIEIKLVQPYPAFMSMAAFGLKPVPKHVVEGQPFVDAPYWTEPMGTGPWKSVEWVQGDHQTFEANDDYWGGRPILDRIVYRFIPDPNAILNSFEAGDVHATFLIPPSEITRLQENPDLHVVMTPFYNVEGIIFNTTHPALSDVRVRQAIAHGFDLQTFTEEYLEGITEPAKGPVIPTSWAFDPTVQPLAYDPERARELLADAGYADGLTLKISTNLGNPFRELEATVMQAQLAEVGITIEIELQEFSVFFPGLLQAKHEIALIGASGGAGFPDPDMLYDGFHCQGRTNRSKYCNPDLDALLVAGRSTMDQAERKAIYSQVQQMLMEEVPEIFAFYRPIPLGYSDKLEGIEPVAGRPYLNIHEWVLRGE